MKLGHNSYGKSDVRVTKVVRRADRHDLIELSVDVELVGTFDATFLSGDNSAVVATDSMKNTIYVFAHRHPLESVESFAVDLSKHFVETYSQVSSCTVDVRQSLWRRIRVKDRPHSHSFMGGGSEHRTCHAVHHDNATSLAGGITDLLILKTTDSGFSGFVRDRYTTLQDTDDRIFATSLSAVWDFAECETDHNTAFETIRAALLETFAEHKSLSVQQTLYAMGEAALERCQEITSIHITMPNKHRLLVNLDHFGLTNANEIFVWTDEPYGNIHATIARR